MPIFDGAFRRNKLRYVAQCLLAAGAFTVILALLKNISNTTVVASLGSTGFIVFTMPQRRAARGRYLIGGYVVGIASGMLFLCLSRWVAVPDTFAGIPHFPDVLFGPLAVAVAMFVMVITNTEHPPAAGVALGFVFLNHIGWLAPTAVLAGIASLHLAHVLLRPVLRDLL